VSYSKADCQDGRASPAVGANGDTSILPIVTSQRDRFRQRNAELEEVSRYFLRDRQADQKELRKQFDSISDLRAEIKSLQSDNLKLYEKVRYTQSYRDTAIPGPSGSSGAGMLSGALRREDDIGRYKDKYEESMNPFEAFKGRVSCPSLFARF
jgi:homeobox protein cut-like